MQQEQARHLFNRMRANGTLSEPAKKPRRLTPLQRADRWVHDHPGAAVSLLGIAALALLATIGN